jgi:hypothetical protein
LLREHILGRELFDHAFKTYAQRWMFKRPDARPTSSAPWKTRAVWTSTGSGADGSTASITSMWPSTR